MLQEFFNLLDLPSSSVRDLVGGENPFDQWASPLSGDHRLSGAQLVSRYTGASPDSWGSTLAGFGAEMVLDPTNLIGGLGLLKKAMAARRANAVGNLTDGGRVFMADARPAGRYGYVNPKAVEAELITDPIRSSPLREDFGQRRIPQMESDYETLWHGTGTDWEAEPDFPLGKPRGDLLLQGTGGNREGPGLYAAQRRSIGHSYYDMLSRRTKEPVTPEAKAAAQEWALNLLRGVDPKDPRRSYVSEFGDPYFIVGNPRAPGDPANPANWLADVYEAKIFTSNPTPDRLAQLGVVRDEIIQMRDDLARETGLYGQTDMLTPSRMRKAARYKPGDTLDRISEYEDKMEYYRRLQAYLDLDFPPTLPPEVSAAIDPPIKYTGGLYELAVPKAKLDKFMYGDKPLEEAAAHIPEAANYPVAVRDTYPDAVADLGSAPENMTGSESVYYGDNRFAPLFGIASRFGIENPTGADVQRILTETFGISGNKYLDAASRTSTRPPTYNHVIWDPEILKDARVRRVFRRNPDVTSYSLSQSLNPMLKGGRSTRASVSSSPLTSVDDWQSGTQVNQLPPTWSPGTERLLNRKAAATLALYNMAARQGGYTVE